MDSQETDDLLATENAHLKRLHEIVVDSIREQELIVDNLLHPASETLTRGQRISDRIARFGGSWGFILSFLVVLAVWIVYNVMAPRAGVFDPYPFILMNLVLSCIAAIQAPVIMMSQNRKEEKDRMRAENDYLVNLKAELQVRSLHQKMDLLVQEQIRTLFDIQARQLELLKRIDERLGEGRN
ncbi:MAG: DUF1003 domain-containing protein [Flavobacteriales bacterium]|nr:DUF1003 domain-containing protein [Flavobacteriales bacterium]MCB9166578.1 DUF1003 domain-containing protein [Flavobacteriales bacterium]